MGNYAFVLGEKEPGFLAEFNPRQLLRQAPDHLHQETEEDYRQEKQQQGRYCYPEQDRQHAAGSGLSSETLISCLLEFAFQNFDTDTPKPRSLLC